ncbi:hypothetical protein [Kitasatospora sp. NPDC057223]|uniref:hypothetical protein n=1 Tax=Kitasatospora sp. NPDC057223 TaxID=3346055 RepID=UPI003632CE49
MNNDVETLGTELGALADAPAPAARLDLAWTIRKGRARLRRRRMSVFGSVTAVAVLASTLALGLPAGGQDGTSVGPAAGGPPPVPAGSPALVADTGHDPLTVEAKFGWLPEGFDGVTYIMGSSGNPTDNLVRADRARPAGEKGSESLIWLKVYPAGVLPPVGNWPGGGQQYQVPAPDVHGRSAYWLGTGPTDSAAPGSDRYLRWETADGRWAEVQWALSADDGTPEVLHRTAEGVLVGHVAVPLPFRVGALPAGATPLGVSYTQRDTYTGRPWEARISFQLDGVALDATVGPDLPEATPTVELPPGIHWIPQACVSATGLKVCATWLDTPEQYAAVGGTDGWLSRFTLLGTDPANWTADVLA